MTAADALGRWIWGLSGVATAVVLAVSGVVLLTRSSAPAGEYAYPQPTERHTVTIAQPVTSLAVYTYGTPVTVHGGNDRRVTVTELIGAGSAGVVSQTLSRGHLTLSDPACQDTGCSVGFDVTVPAGVSTTVSSGGGPVSVTGVRTADLSSGGAPVIVSGTGMTKVDSGGGAVSATRINGSFTATTGGGPLQLTGCAGPLSADSGGGAVVARGIDAATATISTDGAPALADFTVAPVSATVDTGGGGAILDMPGGPYAVTADSGGGTESIGVATAPSARDSLTVTTAGGPLFINPAGGGSAGDPVGNPLPKPPRPPGPAKPPTAPKSFLTGAS
ncbi:MAG TPA: hypothetical protein VG164_01880 [Trebonia sp.]|nr:hypothetical protein [Trebonia sp.]